MMQQAVAQPLSAAPDRVLVVGGGVAGLEALLALRELRSDGRPLRLLSASARPLLPPELFGLAWSGPAVPVDLAARCAALGVELDIGGPAAVDQQGRTVLSSTGDRLGYDALLIAGGAASSAPYVGVATLGSIVLADHLAALRPGRLSIVVPPGVAWTLPAYRVALLAAGLLAVPVEVITPEREPLELFGEGASAMVRELLTGAGVRVLPPHAVPHGSDLFALLDNVITLPGSRGPAIRGLPCDAAGFLPVDERGRVVGAPGVHAAGEVTDRQLCEGGLWAQDAAVVAADIAGPPGLPAPAARVLSGELVSDDGSAVYLHRVLDGEDPGFGSRRPRAAVGAWRLPAWLGDHGDQPTPVAV